MPALEQLVRPRRVTLFEFLKLTLFRINDARQILGLARNDGIDRRLNVRDFARRLRQPTEFILQGLHLLDVLVLPIRRVLQR